MTQNSTAKINNNENAGVNKKLLSVILMIDD